MKFILSINILFFVIFTRSYAQGGLSTNLSSRDIHYAAYASYEYYTPRDRHNFDLEGVNVGVQMNHKFEKNQLTMTLSPNISILKENKTDAREDIILVKWNQGLQTDIDVGKNMLMQPLAQIGIGYGWVDSNQLGVTRMATENAPMAEVLAGINFIPQENFLLFVKAGYRLFEVDDIGPTSKGQLDGFMAHIGMGIGF